MMTSQTRSQLSSALGENEVQECQSGPDALERHDSTKTVAGVANVMADAEDYVDSVMSSQTLRAVLDPPAATPNRRKRSLSLGDSHGNNKKIRGDREHSDRGDDYDSDSDSSESEMGAGGKRNRRYVSGRRRDRESTQRKGSADSRVKTKAEVHVDSIDESDGIKTMIAKLSADMHKLITGVNEKVERVEKTLEKKITDSLTKYFDKRINNEAKKIRREIDERFDTLRSDVKDDLGDLNDKIENISTRLESKADDSSASKLSIVIRDLPYTVHENVEVKVNNLIRDGLKVRDVKVESSTRKDAYDDSKPGVVIAQLKCENDKKKIMKEKKNLKNSTQYKKVYVHNDQKREERLMASNLRLLLNAYKRGDKNISLRGDRIISGRDQDSGDNRRGEGVNDHPWRRADSDRRPRDNSKSERPRRETSPSDRDSTSRNDSLRGDNRRQRQYSGRYSDRYNDRDSGRRAHSGRR